MKLPLVLRGAALALFGIALATGAFAECPCSSQSLFISLERFQTLRNDKEARSVNTSFMFNSNGLFQYFHHDVVLGTLRPEAEDREESYLDYSGKSFKNEQAAVDVLQRTLSTIASLKSGPRIEDHHWPPNFELALQYSYGESKDVSIEYSTEQDATPAMPVVDAIMEFVGEITSHVTVTKSVKVMEGDGTAPVQLSVVEPLAHPDRYDGKRVQANGHYTEGLENSSLTDERSGAKGAVWINEVPSTFGEVKSVADFNGHEISVEGIFLSGHRGHLGMWPGEIKRVTRIRRLD